LPIAPCPVSPAFAMSCSVRTTERPVAHGLLWELPRVPDLSACGVERMKVCAFVLSAVLCCATAARAQQTIVAAGRSVDGTLAGVGGGIPTRTTICSTLNPGATAAQINSAIAACPNGQVVFLNAGTYNLTSGILFDNKSNVTLRGAGADQTFLLFS